MQVQKLDLAWKPSSHHCLNFILAFSSVYYAYLLEEAKVDYATESEIENVWQKKGKLKWDIRNNGMVLTRN